MTLKSMRLAEHSPDYLVPQVSTPANQQERRRSAGGLGLSPRPMKATISHSSPRMNRISVLRVLRAAQYVNQHSGNLPKWDA
jgi:hypothetical protein